MTASRYAVQLQYRKPLGDLASGETRSLRTFSKAAEVRDGTAAGVMLRVSELLDLILVEYLRVNESACERAGTSECASRAEAASPPEAEAEASAAPRLYTDEGQAQRPQAGLESSRAPRAARQLHWQKGRQACAGAAPGRFPRTAKRLDLAWIVSAVK